MSKVWKHFEKQKQFPEDAFCTLCRRKISRKGGCTKGMRKHLQNVHKINLNEEDTDESASVSNETGPSHQYVQPSLEKFVKRDSLGEILAKFAAKDGFSLHAILKSEGIRSYVRLKNFEMPKSQDTLTKRIFEFYEEVKVAVVKEIAEVLKQGGKFSLSCDEWTDTQMRKFMNVTLHGVEKDIVLGLSSVIGSCDAFKTVEHVEELLSEFRVSMENDLVASCNDGASVMVKYGKLHKILAQLCYNHGIHNSVVAVFYNKADKSKKASEEIDEESTAEEYDDEEDDETEEDYLKQQPNNESFFDTGEEDLFIETSEIYDVLKETRSTVKFFRNSSVRKNTLREIRVKKGEKPLNLILDCRTRWTSTLRMCKRFVKLKFSINEALHELGKSPLPDSHFAVLDLVDKILSPAALVIFELSKKTSTLLTAEGSLKFLFESLDEMSHPLAKKLLDTLKEKVLPRRNKAVVSLLYFLHNGVYPKKSKHLDYCTKEETKNFAEKLNTLLFEKHERVEESDDESPEEAASTDSQSKLQSAINDIMNAKKKSSQKTIKVEMNSFEGSSSPRSTRLEKLYQALLTIKPTSTASERVFSVSSFICTRIRNAMSPKLLHVLVFLRYYFLNQNRK